MNINRLELTKESEVPDGVIASFLYRKPGERLSERAILVTSSDSTHVGGNDLNRSGDFRNFRRDRIVGNIIVWGKVTFSDLFE